MRVGNFPQGQERGRSFLFGSCTAAASQPRVLAFFSACLTGAAANPSRQLSLGFALRGLRRALEVSRGLPHKYCKQKTYAIAKPFRCNTYEKQGVGLGTRLASARQAFSSGIPSPRSDRRSFVALCSQSVSQFFCNQRDPHSFSKMPGCHPPPRFPFWNFQAPLLDSWTFNCQSQLQSRSETSTPRFFVTSLPRYLIPWLSLNAGSASCR
jgi:hypothetical protein